MEPLLSIVIPTRNRPHYMSLQLEILKRQNINDMEVIVSDNGTDKLCADEFERIVGDDKRFKYVKPPTELNQYDNFEYGISCAKGSYITLLEDKQYFVTGALEIVKQIIVKEHPLIIANRTIYYNYIDEDNEFPKGTMEYPEFVNNEIYEKADISTALHRIFNFEKGIGEILFQCPGGILGGGFYHRKLIEKFHFFFGRFFAVYEASSIIQSISCYICEETDLVIQVKVPLVIHCPSLKYSRGEEVARNQDFLKFSWNDCMNEELKKMQLSYCDFLYSSHYFFALETEWFLDRLSEYGIEKKSGLCVPHVLANIKWELERCNREGRSKEEKEHDDRVLDDALNKLKKTEKKKFKKCYNELKYGRRNFFDKMAEMFPNLYQKYLPLKECLNKNRKEEIILKTYKSPMDASLDLGISLKVND